MENSKKQLKDNTVKKLPIVNMCEDMNPHKHNEESYNKMIDKQKKQK